jgi:transposase
MNINTIGLDIAKTIFHLVGLDKNGKQIQKKKLRRGQLLAYFANLPLCTIAIEGCGSAFYWQRELTKQGHKVKLLPAQYVKAHLRGNKNDYNDALAIAEASRVPELREVTPKTIEQQGIQALHRLRERTVNDRTSLSNQLRGLLAEFGIIFNQGISSVKKGLPSILEDAENGLPHTFRDALGLKYNQFCQLDDLVKAFNKLINESSEAHKEIELLQSIPGFGDLVSSSYYSVIGDGKAFAKSRDASASVGVVPRQHSTGGKTVLQGISKRGDKYLRKMLINGARSVVNHAHKKDDALSVWVTRLVEKRGRNKATVALANKLARIAWAVTVSGKPYQTNYAH